MNAALAKEFQNRIVNASQSDLVVINYEMLMAELDEAVLKFESQDSDGFTHSLRQATKLLRELSMNLDFQYEIAKDLMSLYIFIEKRFIEASQKNSIRPIQSARDVLSVLLLGWQQAAKNEPMSKVPVIGNGQQVYAGLTYGKGTLNETVYEGGSRGFKA